MSKVLDIQCPACNAPLHFNAKLGKMKCDYCDSVFDPKDLKRVDTEEEKSQEKIVQHENYVTYNCPDCGAEIVADENTSATFCLYCGNTAILKNKLSGEFAPDKIIPFKVEKEDAVKAFKEVTKGKPFALKFFNQESNIEKITGLYVPFWLYELEVNGSVKAVGTRVSSWTSGDRHYTKTDFYDLEREGNMVYKRVPVDGSLKLDNDLMNSLEPFYFHYLEDYNHAYLSGYYAEKYDVTKEDAAQDAETRAIESTKKAMLNDMGNYASKTYKSDTLVSNIVKTEYVLLPIWMVNVKYNNEYYMFAMNGQTGEFIGNIPLDKKKVIIYIFMIFAFTFMLIMLVSYFIFLFGGGAV